MSVVPSRPVWRRAVGVAGALALAASLLGAGVAAAGPAAAAPAPVPAAVAPAAVMPAAIPVTTGKVTSVPAIPGKGRGTSEWGFVGDVETYDAKTTFSYGVAVSPADGSLWVTDSGKVVFNALACRLSGASGAPCQLGSPGVLHYPAGNATATDYQGNGVYKPTRSTNSTGVNAGFGAQYAALSAAQRQDFPGPGVATPMLEHGPRGIIATANGTAWYADSEANAPFNAGVPGALGRLDSNMNPLSGAGFSAPWAQRDQPGVVFYHTGVAEDSTGKVWTNSEISDRFVAFNPDGSPAGSPVLLDLPGPPVQYRNPYSVAIDKADDSFYVPLVNFRDDSAMGPSPFLEKRDKNGTVIGQFTAPNLPKNQVVFSAYVDPVTRHVFAWTESNTGSATAPAFLEWDKDGNLIDTFGTADVPELANVRGMAVDKNGYRYVTVNQGSSTTRVMILAKTPEPVTSVCPLRSADGESVKLAWQCEGPDAENSTTATPDDYGQAPVLDYVVEQREVGTTAWTVTPHAASTQKNRTITGLDPAKQYEFRVSAWNEAGNGDWAAATAVVAEAEDDTIDAAHNTAGSVDVLSNDTFAPAATAGQVSLLDANGDPTTSYAVSGQGTYALSGTEVTFTPEPGFSGTADPARYRVTLDKDCAVEAKITAKVAAAAVLTLSKKVDGDPGAAAPSAWTLIANGPGSATYSGTTGSTEVTRRTVVPGDYTLSESGPTAGYTTAGFVCATNGGAPAAAGTTVSLSAGDKVECEVTNTYKSPITTAQLTLKKTVTGDPGAADPSAFTLSAQRDGTTISGTTGQPAVTNATVQPGSYTLAESGPTEGYTALGYSCAINGDPAQQVGYTLELEAADTAECTITNVYATPPVEPTTGKLTLVKQVDGDAGSAAVSAWTLSATGEKDTISGKSGADAVTSAEVEAGQYALTESGPTKGYSTKGFVCSADGGAPAPAADTVTIKAESVVVCVITNTFKAAVTPTPTTPTVTPTDPTVTPTTGKPTPSDSTSPTLMPTAPTANPLPDTGLNIGWLIPVAVGVMLLAVLLLILARRRNTREH